MTPPEITEARKNDKNGDTKCFAITLKELLDAVEFAKQHGISEHKTIMLESVNCDIGNGLNVISLVDGKVKDITNFDSW